MHSTEHFTYRLLQWHKSQDRKLPWKKNKDPYQIWVSEIILQQTQVKQGLPYYERFMDKFPNIAALAMASEDEVLKIWEGLGYYSRARNMHHTAKFIHEELDGVFPNNYKDILSLKGVGPYTAAAISSFAFDLPFAVLDGNVKRVLSRYFGIKSDISKNSTIKELSQLSEELLDKNKPGQFNQAIMDFGALQCTPMQTDCQICPMNSDCLAYKQDLVKSLPFKSKTTKKRNRYFHYLVIKQENNYLIQKRKEKDIWQGLFEFSLVETQNSKKLTSSSIKEELSNIGLTSNYELLEKRSMPVHILSHQRIHCSFYLIEIEELEKIKEPFNLVDKGNLKNFAFPKIIDLYLA